jgi:hypothetical protein
VIGLPLNAICAPEFVACTLAVADTLVGELESDPHAIATEHARQLNDAINSRARMALH